MKVKNKKNHKKLRVSEYFTYHDDIVVIFTYIFIRELPTRCY